MRRNREDRADGANADGVDRVSSDKPLFRFDVEHALTVDCTYAAMTSPAHLAGLVERHPELSACQIYAVAHRPRVYVDPASFQASPSTISLRFHGDWGDGEPAAIHVELPNIFGMPVRLETVPPHSVLAFHETSTGSLVHSSPAGQFLSEILRCVDSKQRMANPAVDANLLDLTVVYIGQSMDSGGAAQRRLLTHGALQQILADIAYASPHLEPWIILMTFGGYTKLSMFGPWDGSAGDEASEEHLRAVLEAEHGERERIALVEAALIRYFFPKYNTNLKFSFPNRKHKTYRAVYDLDYNAVGFELDSLITLSCRLKSEMVEPSFFHARLFPLHDEHQRRAFWDVWDDPNLAGDLLIRPTDRPSKESATPPRDPHE